MKEPRRRRTETGGRLIDERRRSARSFASRCWTSVVGGSCMTSPLVPLGRRCLSLKYLELKRLEQKVHDEDA